MPGPAQLVSKATRFLSVVVKMPSQRTLFENPGTLEAFCEKIVLPNMSLRSAFLPLPVLAWMVLTGSAQPHRL